MLSDKTLVTYNGSIDRQWRHRPLRGQHQPYLSGYSIYARTTIVQAVNKREQVQGQDFIGYFIGLHHERADIKCECCVHVAQTAERRLAIEGDRDGFLYFPNRLVGDASALLTDAVLAALSLLPCRPSFSFLCDILKCRS